MGPPGSSRTSAACHGEPCQRWILTAGHIPDTRRPTLMKKVRGDKRRLRNKQNPRQQPVRTNCGPLGASYTDTDMLKTARAQRTLTRAGKLSSRRIKSPGNYPKAASQSQCGPLNRSSLSVTMAAVSSAMPARSFVVPVCSHGKPAQRKRIVQLVYSRINAASCSSSALGSVFCNRFSIPFISLTAFLLFFIAILSASRSHMWQNRQASNELHPRFE